MFDVKLQHAVLILEAVSKSKEPVKVQDLGKLYKIGFHSLAQAARRLRLKGIIRAKKGPGGGYVSGKKSIKDVSMFEIQDAMYATKEKLCTKNEQGQKVLAAAEQKFRINMKELKPIP